VASGSDDKSIIIWDTKQEIEAARLSGHAHNVRSIDYSPDGTRIISGSDDHTIKIWDAQSGEELLSLNGHAGPVRSVRFSFDGKRIVSTGIDQTVRIWDVRRTASGILAQAQHEISNHK
jgi:WD40 repeat protein